MNKTLTEFTVKVNNILIKNWEKKCKVIFAKFASFSYYTKAYRQNKNLDDNEDSVHADLTKKRHSVLKKANYLVRNKDDVLFWYADVNWNWT